MNYLAHLVLSGGDSDLRLGNFIGDAVKGDPFKAYAAPIANGVVLHRWIDSYADTAPEARAARAAIRPVLGRFSGVGVDLLYDHFLAKNFARLHPETSLREFADAAQNDLLNRTVEMPARSQRFLRAMVAHDWLVQYGSRQGMLDVCRSMDARLEQRLQTTSPLHRLFEAADAAGFDGLEAPFALFWMRIQTEARSFVQSESLLVC